MEWLYVELRPADRKLKEFRQASDIRHPAASLRAVGDGDHERVFARYWHASAPERHAAVARDCSSPIARCQTEHEAPIDEADALPPAEPGLHARLAGAVHWLDPWSVSDPVAPVQRYAERFVALGGELARGDAATLNRTRDGWAVEAGDVGVHPDSQALR
jgi:hypothetical protein